MSPTTTDRRIVRTKRMLYDALLDIMEEKGFEAVNVRSLTEKAGINRGTFYLHYMDIEDLLSQIKEEILQGMKSISFQMSPLELENLPNWEDPHPSTLQIFEYLAEHARFFKTFLGPKGDPSFPVYMKNFMREHFYEKLATYQQGADMLVPVEYLVTYAISANLGVIQHWFDTDMALSPQEMAVLSFRLSQLGPLQSSGLFKQQD